MNPSKDKQSGYLIAVIANLAIFETSRNSI